MGYIKDLYNKNPELVIGFAKKVFKTKYGDHVSVLHAVNKNDLGEKVLFFMRSTKYNDVQVEPLELNDFSVIWNGDMLNFDDRRLIAYLKFMAKLYGNDYLQGFHDYRAKERNEFNTKFNATTYAIEAKLAEAINENANKNIQKK